MAIESKKKPAAGGCGDMKQYPGLNFVRDEDWRFCRAKRIVFLEYPPESTEQNTDIKGEGQVFDIVKIVVKLLY